MEIMSSGEARIRGEMEMDVERELEEEIKEGICHLALRLHRLYQQQNERDARELPKSAARGTENRSQGTTKNSKILSEISINIKMEGGTKIEIKEIKKEARENRHLRNPKFDQMIHAQRLKPCPPPSTKKFDWVRSLRSGPSAKIDGNRRQSRLINSGSAKTNASQQHIKVNKEVDNKMLELGWID